MTSFSSESISSAEPDPSVTARNVDVWISLSDVLFDKSAQRGFQSSGIHWTELPAENTDNAHIYTLSKPLPVAPRQLSGLFETRFLALACESWEKPRRRLNPFSERDETKQEKEVSELSAVSQDGLVTSRPS